ncbi:hypothetical protein OAB57_01020 [Bacteriovoracaceae bacterium]|nr:hypothetical protein [Bacteriovoracaceae bacterium]
MKNIGILCLFLAVRPVSCFADFLVEPAIGYMFAGHQQDWYTDSKSGTQYGSLNEASIGLKAGYTVFGILVGAEVEKGIGSIEVTSGNGTSGTEYDTDSMAMGGVLGFYPSGLSFNIKVSYLLLSELEYTNADGAFIHNGNTIKVSFGFNVLSTIYMNLEYIQQVYDTATAPSGSEQTSPYSHLGVNYRDLEMTGVLLTLSMPISF